MGSKPNLLHRLVILQFGLFSFVVTAIAVLVVGMLISEFYFPGWLQGLGYWQEGSLLLNVALIAGFGIQHSLMARQGFKRFLLQLLPAEAERHFYVMWSSFFLLMVGALWHLEPGLILDLRGTPWQWVVLGIAGLGWLIVLVAGVQMDGLELLGVRQLFHSLRGKPLPDTGFKVPWLYRHVRHPLYLGMVMGFWFSPCHSADSLLFAAGFTLYLLVGIRFEERDLRRRFGDVYADYARQVPMLIPLPGRRYRGPQGSSAG